MRSVRFRDAPIWEPICDLGRSCVGTGFAIEMLVDAWRSQGHPPARVLATCQPPRGPRQPILRPSPAASRLHLCPPALRFPRMSLVDLCVGGPAARQVAGGLTIVDGWLRTLSPHSGHYQPGQEPRAGRCARPATRQDVSSGERVIPFFRRCRRVAAFGDEEARQCCGQIRLGAPCRSLRYCPRSLHFRLLPHLRAFPTSHMHLGLSGRGSLGSALSVGIRTCVLAFRTDLAVERPCSVGSRRNTCQIRHRCEPWSRPVLPTSHTRNPETFLSVCFRAVSSVPCCRLAPATCVCIWRRPQNDHQPTTCQTVVISLGVRHLDLSLGVGARPLRHLLSSSESAVS